MWGRLRQSVSFIIKNIFKLFAEGCRILRDAFVNVMIFFRNQIKREHEEYRKMISNGYRKFVMLVLVSSIPTGVIGFFGRNAVALASQILPCSGHLPDRDGGASFYR